MAFITVAPAVRSTTAVLSFPAAGVTIPANAQFGSVVFTMPVDAERASTSAQMDFSIEVQPVGQHGVESLSHGDAGMAARARLAKTARS
jgi:hypothetical protein